MATRLSSDDVGKTVVDAEGKQLGVVSSVENNTASVDPNPSVVDRVFATVGWERTDDDAYTITEDMLESVADEVVLRGEL